MPDLPDAPAPAPLPGPGDNDPAAKLDTLMTEADLMREIGALADRLAPPMREGEWTVVSVLLGAIPFTSDLMKALARRGIHPVLDALWLESYRDARESSGRVAVRADISRPVSGRHVLLVDDVYDTGRTLAFAKAHLLAKGAASATTCALCTKPGKEVVPGGVDHAAFAAPPRFLVGYGMDDAGRMRGLPWIGLADDAED